MTKEGGSVTGKFKADTKTLTVLHPQGEGMTFKIDDNGCLYDRGRLITAKACKQSPHPGAGRWHVSSQNQNSCWRDWLRR